MFPRSAGQPSVFPVRLALIVQTDLHPLDITVFIAVGDQEPAVAGDIPVAAIIHVKARGIKVRLMNWNATFKGVDDFYQARNYAASKGVNILDMRSNFITRYLDDLWKAEYPKQDRGFIHARTRQFIILSISSAITASDMERFFKASFRPPIAVTPAKQRNSALSEEGRLYRFPQQPLSKKPPEREPASLAARHDTYYDMRTSPHRLAASRIGIS